MSAEQILVVDDGKENREFVVEYILKPNDFRALVAKDGQEGLELALKHRPDLILLDLQMPRMTGIEVLENLSARNVDIPVILMTFHGSEEIAIEVFRLGVRDYVKKPYSVDEMLLAIERSLTEVRLRKEKEALTQRVLQANRELQLRVQELNVLYSVGKSVSALMQMEKLLPHIVDAAAQLTQAEEGRLFLLNETRLICHAAKVQNSSRAQAVNAEIQDAIASRVIESGEPLLLTPDSEDNDETLTAAYVPLTVGGRVLGVLGVSNISGDSHVFSDHDNALLGMLTDYAAIAIENSHNYEALRASKETEKQHIRGTFERFVAPSVVNQALTSPENLEVGGSRQEVSVLFADIRGFTSWSEDTPPEQVMQMLNDYLSMAAEVIMAWEGTLDKFFGDGLMAIFNAPEPQHHHVHRAADAALALLQAAEDLNKRKGYGLSYSVGVHVGEAIVGYLGTDRAMNYTAIGDVVNLAKRLQEYAAPGQIIVEEAIIKRLGSGAQARPLGEVKVRGRKQNAFAYELQSLTSII